MERKTKVVVLGIIYNGDGKIFLTQRYDPDIPDAHLRWDVPGGTNEFGERLEDTLKREIAEETGLEVTIGDLLPKCVTKTWEHKDYLQHTLVLCYKCSLIKEHLHPKDHKIAALKWETLENLAAYDFLPTTKVFIDLINRPVGSEHRF